MAGTEAKGGRKGRKFGRNKKWCERYRANGTREKNKIRRLRRHCKHFPDDQRAQSRLTSLERGRS